MSATKISLDDLTPEARAELHAQAIKAMQEKLSKKNEDIKTYKNLVTQEVAKSFEVLKGVSEELSTVKKTVFDNFKSLIAMKAELYERESEQQSHTFTNEDGTISITIGYHQIDQWDDTVEEGVALIKSYFSSLSQDKETQLLVDSIMQLLTKDTKGNLKASRVLQLRKIANNSDKEDLIRGVQIIENAYKPVRSKEFIRCEFKDKDSDSKKTLPLGITEAPIRDV
jgi:hypothetical protein